MGFKKFRVYVSVFVALQLLLSSASWSAARRGAQPEPDLQVIQASEPRAETAFGDLYVTHRYDNGNSQMHVGFDIIAEECRRMQEFVRDAIVPAARKFIFYVHYQISDSCIEEVLLEAKRAGLGGVTIVTDLNESLRGNFEPRQSRSTDFEHANYREDHHGGNPNDLTAVAATTKRLLEGGFEHRNADGSYVLRSYKILSIPLYKNGMKPLMHEKAMILSVAQTQDEIVPQQVIESTTNATRHRARSEPPRDEDPLFQSQPRYNRGYEIKDVDLMKHIQAHALEQARTYAQGGETTDLQSLPTLRKAYQDGSSVTLKFTDGRYDLNNAMADRMIQDGKGDIRIGDIIFSEFVLTDKQVMDAMRDFLKSNTTARVSGVVDQGFANVINWGWAAALAGYNVYRPSGQTFFGFKRSSLGDRVDVAVYQRPAPGRHETNPFGPPVDRHVWHDKTAMFYFSEKNAQGEWVDWVEIYTGSYNNSDKFSNSEFQMVIKVKADSPFAQMVRESIEKVREAEREYAVPLEVGVFRSFIAQLTGHSAINRKDNGDFEVPEALARSIMGHFFKGEFDEAIRKLRLLGREPSTLRRHPSAEEVGRRLDRMQAFITWYCDRVKAQDASKSCTMGSRLVTSAFLGLAYLKEDFQDMDASESMMSVLARNALESALWNGADAEWSVVVEAWHILFGNESNPPERRSRAEQTPAGAAAIDQARRDQDLVAAASRANAASSVFGPTLDACADSLKGVTNLKSEDTDEEAIDWNRAW